MRKILPLGAFTLIFALVFIFGACDDNNYINPDTSISWPPSAIPLTESIWADGNIATAKGKQWFGFTATADTQYIHFEGITLNVVDIRLYDAGGEPIGSSERIYGYNTYIGYNTYMSRTVTSGGTYYVLITPFYISSDGIGAYKIAFNAAPTAPPSVTLPTENVTTLAENEWANGNITTAGGEQWFSFTATAGRHYIHFEPGVLNNVYVQVCDTNGVSAGFRSNLYSRRLYDFWAVTSGNEYYIRVTPYSNGGSGTYRIAFNTYNGPPSISLPAPSADITTLAETDKWYDGVIPTAGGVQWFKFTATADTQFIRFTPGTLNSVSVQICDIDGNTIKGQDNLSSSNGVFPMFRAVTSGNEYYIRVTPYSGSGAYKIAFNAISVPIGVPVTPLTINEWSPSCEFTTIDDFQWFQFTASDSTHHIHFKPGTMTNVSMRLYDRTGTIIGEWTSLNGSIRSTSLAATSGHNYFIRVATYTRDDGTSEGTFKMAFSASGEEPSDP